MYYKTFMYPLEVVLERQALEMYLTTFFLEFLTLILCITNLGIPGLLLILPVFVR